MFNELLKYFKTLQNYNGAVENNIIVLTDHFKNETPRLIEIFRRVNLKYDYDRYEQLVDIASLDTHIEFWRGSGEFDLAVLQASLNGVYDPDPDFGRFYDQYKLCDWTKFNEYQNDDQANLFYELQYDLFYTWLAFMWQNFNNNLGGFPVKVLENNAATIFNLIDFAWFDNSLYHNFLDKPIRRTPLFNRELSMTELYSRVKIPYRYEANCSRKLEKQNEIVELKINEIHIELSFAKSDKNEIIHLTESNGYKNYPIYVNRHNELLNDGWNDITFIK
jgi:hypothetical protein